jgi:hypothetical protein
MCTSPVARSHRGGHSRLYNPSEPKLHLLRSRLYTLYEYKTSDGKVKTVEGLLRVALAVARCGVRHPLKTVLKPSRKPTGKSVNLQDTTPHEPRPGAPGPHRQVLGAAFEPPMSIWAPVVLGGCLGCSIWSINSKRRPLRTMGVT